MIVRKADVNMIVVSACLIGLNCRYDGSSCLFEGAVEVVRMGLAVPLCPEQLGGLPTPRLPCEIKGNKVVNLNGLDMTGFFDKGVKESLHIVDMLDVKVALLKEKSPSCGVSWVYDGSFSGSLRRGQGFFASALSDRGVTLFSENNFTVSRL